MNYMNYTMKVSDGQDWEMTLAAPEEAVLKQAVSCFDRMLVADGIINIDASDLITMFKDKGTVWTDCIKVPEGAGLQDAAVKLLGRLQEHAEKELSNVLLVIVGDIGFTDAIEVASLVQEQVEDNANIVFGIFDKDVEAGVVEVMLAVV